MPKYNCVVPGCNSDTKVPAHSFPKDPVRVLQWKKAIHSPRLDELLDKNLKHLRICALHFTEDDVIETLVRRKLREDVVPSLHLPEKHHVDSMKNAPEELNTHLGEEMCVEEPEDDAALNPQEEDKAAAAEFRITKRKRRNIHSKILPSITPRVSEFCHVAEAWKRRQYNHVAKLKSFRRRLATAKSFIKDNGLKKYNKLNPAQKLFLKMQLHNVDKEAKGRRFSTSEKMLALSIMKQSGKSYRFLSEMFTLPSRSTLNELITKISLDTGINHIIMSHLKKATSEMKDARNKYCILMWDEVALKPHIAYDKQHDKIIGFEDWQCRRTNKFADHALVFMLRGLFTAWKVPIAYFFCEDQTVSHQLMKCIRDVTNAVSETGLQIVATCCDQRSSMRVAINQLLLQTNRKRCELGQSNRRTIDINGVELIPLYDPPHLIKGIRNNLLTKDLEANVGKDAASRLIASWRPVMLAYEIDVNTNMLNRQLQKITEEHVVPTKIKKMRVKCATQIFSKQVSSYIEFLTNIQGSYHIETRIGPKVMPKEEGKATAKILNFFNDLMDSVNGHSIRPETSLRVAITKNSTHHKFWEKALEELRHMQYIDPNTHERTRSVPSLRNWIYTLCGFQKLWELLSTAGFKNFKPRYVNQDPLENFFSKIRSIGGRNNNPTCDQFVAAFKVLLVNNLTSRKTLGKNCEDVCDGTMLFTLEQFLKDVDNQHNPANDRFENNVVVPEEEKIIPEERRATIKNHMADYIGRKALSLDVVKNCFYCKTSFFKPRIAANKESNFEKIISKVQYSLHTYVPTICFKRRFSEQLQEKIKEELGTSWTFCTIHVNILNEFLSPEVETYYMKQLCKQTNEILSGKQTTLPLDNRILERALLSYRKRSKKQTNKATAN